MKKIIGLTLIILLATAVGVNAQFSKAGTVGLQFLKIGVGARALGMGQTFVSLADDASALFWNPGGISRLEGTHVVGAFTRWFTEINHTAVGIVHTFPGIGTFGVSAIVLNTGYMLVRTAERLEGTGETFTFGDWAAGVSYGRNLTDRFSFGGTLRLVREDIVKGEFSDTGVLADIGVLYDTGYRGLKLGMSITNFGPDFRFKVDDDRDGKFDEDRDNDLDDDGDLLIDEDPPEDAVPPPLTFRAGISMPVYSDELNRITTAFEVVHPNDNVEQYNIGAEYWLKDMVALRVGYRSNLNGNEDKDSYKHVGEKGYKQQGDYPFTGLAAGIGFKYSVAGLGTATIDYAYNNYGILGTIHRASFSVSF